MSATSADKMPDLSKFKAQEILNNMPTSKKVVVLGTFEGDSDKRSIVFLEKNAFTADDVWTENDMSNKLEERADGEYTDTGRNKKRKIFADSTQLEQVFINDIYGNFLCFPIPEHNSIKATVIRPCTSEHIKKYRSSKFIIVQETPFTYEYITAHRILNESLSLDWVYNILEHKKEKERIFFEDPCKETGFILLPDLKWDYKCVDSLHMLAIVNRRDLASLRSLNASHLPLLKNIRDKGCAALYSKLGIGWSDLRIYFHYQPSFYHLHVHFTVTSYDGADIFCERSHLLTTVINNIEIANDYYQRATLPFPLPANDLYAAAYSTAFDREMCDVVYRFFGGDPTDHKYTDLADILKSLDEKEKVAKAEIERTSPDITKMEEQKNELMDKLRLLVQGDKSN